MKIKLPLLLLLLCSMSMNIVAQNNKKKTNNRITSKVYLENLVKDESSLDYVITSEHVSSVSGIKHTYIRQAIDGIEVLGTESSIHKNASGQTIVANVNLVDAIGTTVKNKSASITAEQAIQSVARQMGYQISGLAEIEIARGINQKALFNKADISNTDIPVKLMYYFQEGKGTTLIWELSVEEKDSADWWNFRVDASTGIIIDKENFTVSCLEGAEHSHDHAGEVCDEQIQNEEKLFYTVANAPSAMVGSYNVTAMPDESPQHGSLSRTVVANPDNATASPFGWHDTDGVAGAESEYTIGNNTDAYDDRTSTVTGTGSGIDSERAFGGPSLTFSDPFNTNVTAAGTDNSIDAAVTNLFYWANIIHDVFYIYGFDEASGNFQENNYGNGGVGGDSVRSEAQDGSGTCNANFSTPADGGKGRMQMYVCGTRDGDFDNGVIIHEYAHGISTRLTGGAGTSCLNNQEQMGEGWGDYFGLVLTMEAGDAGTDPRGIGTWLLGQSAGGAGIRDQRYDTDTNTYSYDTIKTAAVPHGVGSVWAMMLWEMTWELIAVHGWDADIYNGTGGNNIALNLVTEGMKLQGCSPGFIDGRDAILAADMAIYGGANECAIWAAFATRGLGFSASQGASSSRSDGTEAFDLPVATLTLSRTSACDSEGTITGLTGGGGYLAGGVYSGTGVTDDGNGMTFSFDAATAGVGSHIITYTDSNCGAVTSDTDTIIVTAPTTPVVVCQDTTVILDGAGNATITNTDVVANLPAGDYIEEVITFAPQTNTGTTVSLGDDNGTGALAIGFDFSFYGTNYSNFYIASNGWISFTGNSMTGAASRNATALPTSAEPNAMVAGVWDDLDASAGGTIRYQTIGSSPNQKLLVDFVGVPHWNDGTTTVTFQIQLHEGSDRIELHYTDAQNNGGVRTAGIENAAGDDGLAITGGNLTVWTASNEAYAIYQEVGSLADNCGFPVIVSLDKSSFTCRDIGTNTVTITADDGNGGIATCDATVTVVGETTTYTGTWDNGDPDAGKKAIFNSSYNTSTADIDACSCEVANNATVTVAAGDYMNIDGNITVGTGSSLLIEHTGSIVQVDDAAVVTNNGTINVNLTTPALNARDFLIMGSPMTAEDDAMFSAYQVLNHTTANFTPYVGTPPVVGVNFHDQESNDWSNYTGTLNPGEGYFVRPSYTTGAAHNYTYDQGTLNNGVITYAAFFGDDKEDSPNVMSNPYASAIDADLLISSNAIIDELYFWQHNTTPSAGIPGPLNENFNSEDISTRNFMMGIAAATGGGLPTNIISTGQGFGIKANAAGDVTFNNALRLTTGNTTIRQTMDKDLLWIEVRENTYGLGSTAGIGFTEGATPGIDSGYDTMKLGTVVSLYSHLANGSEQLGIQGREAFDSSITIPMGFSTLIEADAGIPYVINISNLEGINIEQATVYLIDHLTNTITNLSTDRYEFLSDAGTFDNRFTLQFEDLVLGTNDTVLESVSVYPNPAQNILNIVSPKAVVTAVAVYDVRGRVVSERVFTSAGINYQVDLSGLETALYFVKISTESGTITKRVVKQ